MGEWEDPFNVLGFVGGVVLASALLPQIYLAHKRKSTADISYMWQASSTYVGPAGFLLLRVLYNRGEVPSACVCFARPPHQRARAGKRAERRVLLSDSVASQGDRVLLLLYAEK